MQFKDIKFCPGCLRKAQVEALVRENDAEIAQRQSGDLAADLAIAYRRIEELQDKLDAEVLRTMDYGVLDQARNEGRILPPGYGCARSAAGHLIVFYPASEPKPDVGRNDTYDTSDLHELAALEREGWR